MVERVDCVVIGAGVIGLAVARALVLAGREVLVLESQADFGTGISSRSSEVVHGGMYYPPGSLRARLCVRGNRMLRQFCTERRVAFQKTGKLIVAAEAAEVPVLDEILARGEANGVPDLMPMSGEQACDMEPELRCVQAVWSPHTAIVDSHGLMMALLADIEDGQGMLVLNAPVLGGKKRDDGFELSVGGREPMDIVAKTVVVAAGLSSPAVARSLGLRSVPQEYLCKGSYFSLAGKMPFSHLVYPVPLNHGLGVHFTLDLQGRGRFGPDVEWVKTQSYEVDPARSTVFLSAITRYWPGAEGRELTPAYAGIRPKIYAPNQPAADFLIHSQAQHGALGVIALYGIESPGLTSSLALAKMVAEMV